MGVEARARRDRLLEAQQEAEREAKREAAAEAARLEAQAREVAARVAAASKAREEAVAAVARADALEWAIADETDYGEGGGSEAVVPNQCICSITAEIMTDPVTTVSLALRPR